MPCMTHEKAGWWGRHVWQHTRHDVGSTLDTTLELSCSCLVVMPVRAADWPDRMRRAWLSGVAWDSTRDYPHEDLCRENVLAWHALQHPDCRIAELVSRRLGAHCKTKAAHLRPCHS